ncbi:hypothetical protein [Demequina lignilytica]|uniref:Uncharacterized protein n=1 Tax=Demequina lignilytica TaxID=3051663 RepID=A0AB35MH33_9MICO|nr:hypothetical protein [Demequina sp. SYSU T0a273]MDN4483073.1 hypothetical protein [Demequina sp. SYSU T0a273]
MIIPALVIGFIMSLARARWWGILLVGALFAAELAFTTDNAWYTLPASAALAAVNAAVGWGLGWLVVRGITARWRLARGTASSGHDDGPLPREQAAA